MKAFTIQNGLLAAALAAFSASGAERKPVEVDGRVYYRSCTYYSGIDGDAWVRFTNAKLPWGSQVKLIWSPAGFRQAGYGEVSPIHWPQREVVEMSATEPSTWTSPLLHLSISDRGGAEQYWNIEFVFEITWPDGHVTWDNGSASSSSYYTATLKGIAPGCLDSRPAPVEAVDVTTTTVTP